MDELEPLRKLHSELWYKEYDGRMSFRRDVMTPEKWSMVLHMVAGLELPCTVHGTGWQGFEFKVFEPPIYPGLPAETVLIVSSANFSSDMGTPDKIDLMEGMYRLAATKRNFEMLDLFEIKHPTTKYDIWEYRTLCLYKRESSR